MKRLLARWVVVASAAGISAWLLARPVGLIAHGVAPDKSSNIPCPGLRAAPNKTGCGLHPIEGSVIFKEARGNEKGRTHP